MDWERRMEMTGDMLDRIVVLLLAIADLAERAAGASEARRCLVLRILRTGEAVARDFVRAPDAAGWTCAPGASVPRAGHEPEDAMALALSLRTLALLLRSFCAKARRRSFPATGNARDAYGAASVGGLCHTMAEPLDTS
ncbi:MAG: hypothetical protein Q8Q62_10885 [Mesorhizobium sp.]|nr:hypothetical protein [Mesorhizobium sp.]